MNQPPIHSTWPLLQLFQWIADPLPYLETCYARYGDCFTARLASIQDFYFLNNPADIEQVFTANPALFDVGRANWLLRSTLGDNSLLLLDGDRHQRQRQLLMPPFHGERMKAYGELIGQITQTVIGQWPIGQTFVLRPSMQEISLRVILQAVFGLSEGTRCDRIRSLMETFLGVSTSRLGFTTAFFPFLQRDFGPWSPGRRFRQLLTQLDNELYAEIRDRRNHFDPERPDILTLLLAARDQDGQPMTDQELRDELMTLLLAGHETTATALTWALYWIHYLPTVKARLLEELASLGDNPEVGDIVRLPYLNAVCSETLRIYPIAIIVSPRITKQPIQIGKYTYAANTKLVPCIYLVHQREDLYPQPKQFKPERFLERQFSPYEYLPFGGSNRRCIGAAFALYEMKVALATILRACDLALDESRPVLPIRRGVTTAPKGGVHMRLLATRG